MITVDGYTTIGQIHGTTKACDIDAYTLLLIDKADNLFRIDVHGSIAKGNTIAKITPDVATPVHDTFGQLAHELHLIALGADDTTRASVDVGHALAAVARLLNRHGKF